MVEGVHKVVVEETNETVQVGEMVTLVEVQCIKERKSPIMMIGLSVMPFGEKPTQRHLT